MKKSFKLLSIALVAILLASCAKPLPSYEDETTKKSTTKQTETTKKETTAILETEETTTIKPSISPQISVSETDRKTGYKVVKFGTYDHSIGTDEEIEWLVLNKNTSSYLLISRYVIDCINFNEVDEEVAFINSSLNTWLNEDFLNKAFTEDEIEYLQKVTEFKLKENNLVSIPNVAFCAEYFGVEDENKENYKLSAIATPWAKSNHVDTIDAKNTDFYDCAPFFLSDHGETLKKVAYVNPMGHVNTKGESVKLNYGDGVRPVIVVNKAAFANSIEISRPELSTEEETLEESTEEGESNETAEETEETTINREENIYSNVTSIKYKSVSAPTIEDGSAIDINTEGRWEYGRTPLEWIYVAPNYQIICNNKPNSSTDFSFKQKASSGSLGCYIPIFTNSSAHGEDYEGRFYSIADYTKTEPGEMSFTTKFEDLYYGEYNIKELLEKKYIIGKISRGLVAANGEYVNIVYVSELEEIIKSLK